MSKHTPAFPAVGIINGNNYPAQKVYYKGMTLRDYFAAKAMQGFLANQDITAFIDVVEAENRVRIHKMLGETSFDVADAMLEARGE